jgi:3-phenylpropionate/trans-cinnamate dioxygenase ferredoxin subunit
MVAQFVKVCKADEIEEGKTKTAMVGEFPVILAKDNGQIYALEGVCSHDDGEFQAGEKVCDGQIECPRHGARFDIKTGEATRMPAIASIASYEVKIENDDVLVVVE